MNNNDTIQRFIFENANVRGEIVHLTSSYQTIIEQHHYPRSIRHILGQILVAASLLNSIIKTKGRLTVQFQGKDALKLLIAQCNHKFELRGLAQYQKELSEEELLLALKEGTLAIIIHPDKTTSPYQGIVAWKGDSFARSIEGYFKDSEQLPTRLWVAVTDTVASGLLLQSMPKEGLKKNQPIEENKDWDHIQCLTETITDKELIELDNPILLHRLYSEEQVRVFEPIPITFRCTCSLLRCEQAILMLGEEEAEKELKDKQKIVVTCEFCGKAYDFDRVDVANIFKKGDSSSTRMH